MKNSFDDIDIQSRQMISFDNQFENHQWKTTAATLFNPYLNLPETSSNNEKIKQRNKNLTGNKTNRTQSETPFDHNKENQLKSRFYSRQLPSPDGVDDVSQYVQQMIHNQFCGRSGTPSDRRYNLQINQSKDNRTTKSTPSSRLTFLNQMRTTKQSSKVSDYELDQFFEQTDEQISRMSSSNIHGRETNQSQIRLFSRQSYEQKNPGEHLTLADMCYLASNIGDKMSQTKEKVGLEAIRGFRLPSARLNYDHYQHQPMEGQFVLGQTQTNETIRLKDVLNDDNYSNEPIIEIVENKSNKDKIHRNQFKDWRGNIGQGHLPQVKNLVKREYSGRIQSPQRPCTAASYLSKSRPNSTSIILDKTIKEQQQDTIKQNKQINETNEQVQIKTNENSSEIEGRSIILLDPPSLSLTSENDDELRKRIEIHQHLPTPDQTKSSSKFETEISEEDKFNSNNCQQIYQSEKKKIERNSSIEPLNDLTISQLELLEQYDPMISAKIGVPFIPLQILSRPRQAQQSTNRTVEQIQRDYPKKNGQPIFEPKKARSAQGIIGINQTLQLTKSKRIRVDRQTSFESVCSSEPIENSIQIRSYEKRNEYELVVYSSSNKRSILKDINSTRSSSKGGTSQLESTRRPNSIIIQSNNNHFVQSDRLEKFYRNRSICRTSIVSNVREEDKSSKDQQRFVNVFLTEDQNENNNERNIRSNKQQVEIKNIFRGSINRNLYRKFDLIQREKRENQRRAAITIQRAFRQHLQRLRQIEERNSISIDQFYQQHRRCLSAKKALAIQKNLTEQNKIREENKDFKEIRKKTGPSIEIYKYFNKIDDKFSLKTLNRAAKTIQRHWRGFRIRKYLNQLKDEVRRSGDEWKHFIYRYRQLIRRIQILHKSEENQFIFDVEQTRDFLIRDKKLSTIFKSISFNEKLDFDDLNHFFNCSDLSFNDQDILNSFDLVQQYHQNEMNKSLSKEIVFDIVYYLNPPLATRIQSNRN